ncbi:TonB-dependent receptor [Kordiimonas sp.]|uniref:TonB-dependent receptor n=1 Tax=Kordiimonas sp. TaxID=1970157 RepID=UPI003A94099F
MSRNKKWSNRLLLGTAAAALLASSAAVMAEDYTTGTMRGLVRDEAGTVLPGVTVVVTSDKGVRRTIESDADGQFRLPRLPVGRYTVTVEQSGYETLVADDVQVSLGAGGAYTFTLDSLDNSIEEIYVTGSRRGTWSFNTTTTGLTLDVGEIFSRTPIGRNQTSMVLLAPGTTEGEQDFAIGGYSAQGTTASIGGSSVGENAYYINGMNVTNFRTMIGGTTIPFEFYEQIEVKTGGYSAEFGRATGGVINAVSKSGSNEFRFGANIFWEPDALRGKAKNTYDSLEYLDELGRRNSVDSNIWLSGPLIKDKLFFFGMFNPRYYKSEGFTEGSAGTLKRNDPFWGAKIDFVPFDGHRLEFTAFSDDQSSEYHSWNFDPQLAEDHDLTDAGIQSYIGGYNRENGGGNYIFRYTGVMSDWFTISALYGESTYKRRLVPDTADVNPIRDSRDVDRRNYSTGLTENNVDKRKNYRIDADFYFKAMGNHHIRVGYDKEELLAENETVYNGDGWFRRYLPEYFYEVRYYNIGTYGTDLSAMYIQDEWELSDNLTLTLGIRNETFDNKNVNGESFAKIDNQLAPRFGFSWTPNGGKGRVYGHWGRYFLPISTQNNIRAAGAELQEINYYEYAGADAFDPASFTSPQANDSQNFPVAITDPANLFFRQVYQDGTTRPVEEITDSTIKPMYQDEMVLGYEHNFDSGWILGARVIYRDLKRLTEDVMIDHGILRWGIEQGYNVDDLWEVFGHGSFYVLTNPGTDVNVCVSGLPGETGCVDVNISAESLGYPEGKRTYKALEFTFERPWDGKWSVQGSYTLSRAKGNYEGNVNSTLGQDDAGVTADFDAPGFVRGAYGLLPNHRAHRLNVFGSYAITDRLIAGASVRIQSPRKFGCLGTYADNPDFTAQEIYDMGNLEGAIREFANELAYAYGAASFSCGGQVVKRGTKFESDWTKTLSLSLGYTPDMGGLPGDLTFRVDVFNVFNSQAVTDIYEAYDNGDPGSLDDGYGRASGRVSPRQVRLSASYTF